MKRQGHGPEAASHYAAPMDARGSAHVVARWTSLALVAGLLMYWWIQPVGLLLKLLAAVLVIGSVIRPAAGALAFAAIAPVSTSVAGLFGSPGLGAELLGLVALAIGSGVVGTQTSSDGRTRSGMPALLLAVVAIASATAMIPASAASMTGAQLSDDIARFESAQRSPVWAPLFVAMMTAASAVLVWAVERLVRRVPQLGTQLLLAGIVGHAVSAAQSIQAVMRAAERSGHAFEALPGLLMSVRLSLQMDWNAAASAFLLAAVAGFGLAKASGLRRLVVMVLLVIVGAGLWITGSRIAIVLAALATIGTLGWLAIARSRHRFALAGALVAVIVAVGMWLTVFYPEGRNDKVGDTIRGRLLLMKAGIKMAEEAPVFGIGVDRFYDASMRYADLSASRVAVTLPENAHNNFVQVLAEQGIAGLLALIWLLFAVIGGSARAQWRQPTPVRGALLLAVAVCVATWLTGHPLLVPEFAFVFWLYAGVLAALSASPNLGASQRFAGVCVVAVVLSLPMRAAGLRNTANLEYRGLGVSLWQHDDTQRYRNAGSTFALFLPATGRPIEVPLRRAPGAPGPLMVTIQMDGKPVNRITVDGDAWLSTRIIVPRGDRHFTLVRFVVEAQAFANSQLPVTLLRVGKEAAR